MIRTADRIPAQRDTLYNLLARAPTPAEDPTDERVVSAFLDDGGRSGAMSRRRTSLRRSGARPAIYLG